MAGRNRGDLLSVNEVLDELDDDSGSEMEFGASDMSEYILQTVPVIQEYILLHFVSYFYSKYVSANFSEIPLRTIFTVQMVDL